MYNQIGNNFEQAKDGGALIDDGKSNHMSNLLSEGVKKNIELLALDGLHKL